MELPNNFGEKVVQARWKFGRSDNSNSNTNVSKQVDVGEGADLKLDTKYGIKMAAHGGVARPFTDPVTFTARTYSDRERFSVPMDIIKQCNIKPGHSVSITVYEYEESQAELTNNDGKMANNENIKETVSELLSDVEDVESKLQSIQEELDND